MVKRTPTAGNRYAAEINKTGEAVSQLARRLGIAAQTIHAGLRASGWEIRRVAVKKAKPGEPRKIRIRFITPEEVERRRLQLEERAGILARLMRGELSQREAARLITPQLTRRGVIAWLDGTRRSEIRERALQIISQHGP